MEEVSQHEFRLGFQQDRKAGSNKEDRFRQRVERNAYPEDRGRPGRVG